MTVRLFVKSGCSWCDEAMEWLDERNIDYTLLNVTGDAEARNEMRELTGQGKAPSIDVNGEILADFGADELEAWWEEKGFPVGEK